ncbi:zinc finger MYM-type 1-like isoform X1 [Paramuricea clavata]|uniref:Zinc finger MYM-type 1-like isoform X1 n=1 Tax=Paramuricea clavata TaxID=317549 RepID=A0A7D9IVC4_PARCT|nr:zinc finger MYM-type 1-like isoform X1 [Paramuricea clavata]
MPNKERCKRQREGKLHTAASNVPKLSCFGFTKITHQSVQVTNTNNESANTSLSNVLHKNNREHDVEFVSGIPTSTEVITCTTPVNNDSGININDDDSLLVGNVNESSSDEEDSLSVSNDPDWPETNNDSFSVTPAISVPSETILESESFLDTLIPESDPTSTHPSTTPSPGRQSPCCTQSRIYQPTFDELKKTSVRQTSPDGKHRQCPMSIFSKYSWATYCLTQGSIACFFCKTASEKGLITFTNYKNNAFCAATFANWKRWQEKLEKHHNSNFHREAIEKISCLNNAKMNVGAQLNDKYKGNQELHRYLFLKQLSSLKYLVRQGLALRGHERIDSNLIQLLKTRAEDVPELNNWIENRQYLSPIIINELLEMMGNTALRSILEDIRNNSGFFGLIADESRDISNKEQLTCILRWVSLSDLMTHEDFIGMYLVEKPDAETIAASLKDILLRCSLNLNDCFWQAYDGAATMSGHLSGVVAGLQNENPVAFRIHCSNHRLDLALKGCANESKIIGDTLSFVQDLAVFIRHSPLRMSTYERTLQASRWKITSMSKAFIFFVLLVGPLEPRPY